MSNIEDYLEFVHRNDLISVRKSFKKEYLYFFGKHGFTPFLQACQLGYLELVSFFLEKEVDLGLPSSNGWNGLHWAAGDGYNEVVELLLKSGANKESETNKKYRPLHCATVSDHYKTVRLLLGYGCDHTAKNNDGHTPLDIAEDMGNKRSSYLLNKWINYPNIFGIVRQKRLKDFTEAFLIERVSVKENKSGKTVLDVAVESKSVECLDHVILEDIDENVLLESLKWTLSHLNVQVNRFKAQYNLYRSILFDLRDKFGEFALVDVINSPWILTGESFLDTCVRYNRKDMVVDTLLMVIEYKKTLDTAEAIARVKGFIQIRNIITQRKNLLEASERAHYSRLHIAIQDNRVDVVKAILSKDLVDCNINHHVVGPPICYALFLRYGACVQALIDHGVKVNVTNKYKQTPLHIAVENGMTSFCSVIVEKTEDVDTRDLYGFTSLHHAVINKDEEMCRLLLNRGATLCIPLDIQNGMITDTRLNNSHVPLSNIENPVTLSLKLHKSILPPLMEKIIGNDAKFALNGNTFLHLSSELLLSETSDQLIRQGADVNMQNMDGNTPLHELFIKCYHEDMEQDGFMDTLVILVESGTDINLLNNESISPFRCALDTTEKSIVGAMLKQCDKVDCEIEDFFTVHKLQWNDVFQKMWSLQELNFQSDLIMESIKRNMEDVVNSILENSSEDLRQTIIEDCLYNSAILNNEAIFDIFLDIDLQNSKFFLGGETLLTKLITAKDEKYSMKLAMSTCGERFLDLPNEKQQTPLYLAAANGCLKLCKHLVVECQNSSYSDNSGETAMERLFESSSDTKDEAVLGRVEKIVKTMINSGMDINRVNKANKRAISFCKNDKLKKNLEGFQAKADAKRPKQPLNNDEDKNMCGVCLDKPVNCQFGCGHPFCKGCAEQLDKCPTCRKTITQTYNLYL